MYPRVGWNEGEVNKEKEGETLMKIDVAKLYEEQQDLILEGLRCGPAFPF